MGPRMIGDRCIFVCAAEGPTRTCPRDTSGVKQQHNVATKYAIHERAIILY